MNSVNLIGRIATDFNKSVVGKDKTPKVFFVLAVDNGNKGNDNADFIPVNVFGNQAKSLVQYMHKGSQIGVSGRITSWRSQDGASHLEVTASRVEFLETKKEATSKVESSTSQKDIKVTDEDIPF